MALAYTTTPTTLRVTIKDKSARTSVKDFIVPTTEWNPAVDLLSALVVIRDALVTALDAIEDGLLYQVLIVIEQQESVQLPTPICSITDIASLVMNLSGGTGKKAVLQVPCPEIGIFSGTEGSARDTIDVADVALNAYTDQFKLTGGVFTLSDGETVDDTVPIVSGKRISRKSSVKPG